MPVPSVLRAEKCRVAAIVDISGVFSLPRDELCHIAEVYSVLLLIRKYGTRRPPPRDTRASACHGSST